MNCEDCIAKIEEYFEADLNLQPGEEAFAHILVCDECNSFYDYLKQEQEALALYLFDIKASPALRSGLEAQIKAEKQNLFVPQVTKLNSRIRLIFGSLRFGHVLAGSFALLLVGASIGLLMNLLFKKVHHNQESVSTIEKNNGKEIEIISSSDFFSSLENSESAKTNSSNGTPVITKNIAHKSPVSMTKSSAKRQIIKATVQKTKNETELIKPGIIYLNNTNVNDYKRIDTATNQTPNQQDDLERETRKQAEKSQILLRSFRNAAYAEGEPLFDLEFDKKQARKLVQNNVSLRQRAELADNFEVKELLDNLEPYLLEIANLRDDATVNDLRSIKDRIRKQEIIASLQVY